MEFWQREYIYKNQDALVDFTVCNPMLLSILSAADVLNINDVEFLASSYLGPHEKSKKLYDILVTRSGAYDILIKALQETNQTGALNILLQATPTQIINLETLSYDKQNLLGSGEFGTKVFLGKCHGQSVAVKVFSSVEDHSMVTEIETMKILIEDHKNVVKYFSVETHNSDVLITMELCRINLQEHIRHKTRSISPIAIIHSCTKGLAHLHKHNVIHRNLKPSNILIYNGNQVKLSDYGFVRSTPSESFEWMAPEMIKGLYQSSMEHAKWETPCDIFSLGCVFFYVMTEGSHPFGTRASRISNILHDKATLEKLNNHAGWQSIIKNMISIDPMNRPCAEKILFNEDFSLASGSEWTQCDSANFCVEKQLNEYASQGPLEKPNEGGRKKRTVSEESGVYGWGSHDSQENSAFSSKQLSHTTNDSQLTSDAIRRGTLGAIAATSIGILVGNLLINSRNRPYNHERSWKHVQISSMASNEDFPSTSTESKGMLTPVISYNKSELLGKGSFGTKVYKGKFDGRAVAVKVISCTLVEPAKVIEEIQFLKLLDEHENIVRYIVAAKDENFIYIALELCSNNLQNVIENSLPLDSMDAITKCSKGLSYLHQNKIIHRDLKPANILINRLGQIKISDFGLATEIEDGFTSVTINGALGTADWMAPETLNFLIHGAVQNESLKVTTSSDIFSLGCIFYFVLTKGQHPFGKQGDRQYHIRHNNLQIHDTSIDKEMLHLIKSMLSQFPKERPDISMVLHELILKQKRLMYTDQ